MSAQRRESYLWSQIFPMKIVGLGYGDIAATQKNGFI